MPGRKGIPDKWTAGWGGHDGDVSPQPGCSQGLAGKRWEGLECHTEADAGHGPHWRPVGRGCLSSHLLCARVSWLQPCGNLPTEACQQAALFSQVAQHFMNNLGPCLTFPVKVCKQLPCPHSTDLARLLLC